MTETCTTIDCVTSTGIIWLVWPSLWDLEAELSYTLQLSQKLTFFFLFCLEKLVEYKTGIRFYMHRENQNPNRTVIQAWWTASLSRQSREKCELILFITIILKILRSKHFINNLTGNDSFLR